MTMVLHTVGPSTATGEKGYIMNSFGGYKHVAGYGWIPEVKWVNYLECEYYDYWDYSKEDDVIIVYDNETGSFAWTKREWSDD